MSAQPRKASSTRAWYLASRALRSVVCGRSRGCGRCCRRRPARRTRAAPSARGPRPAASAAAAWMSAIEAPSEWPTSSGPLDAELVEQGGQDVERLLVHEAGRARGRRARPTARSRSASRSARGAPSRPASLSGKSRHSATEPRPSCRNTSVGRARSPGIMRYSIWRPVTVAKGMRLSYWCAPWDRARRPCSMAHGIPAHEDPATATGFPGEHGERREGTRGSREGCHGRVCFAPRLCSLSDGRARELTGDAQDAREARTRRLMDALVAAYPDFLAGARGQRPRVEGRHAHALRRRHGRQAVRRRCSTRRTWRTCSTPPIRRAAAACRQRSTAIPAACASSRCFDKMYGDCTKGEVARHLVDVVWLPSKGGQTLKVDPRQRRRGEAAGRLRRARQAAGAVHDAILVPSAGTYNCRAVAGTSRVSAHGHGIAIDIAIAHADYWRWTRPAADGRYALPATAFRGRSSRSSRSTASSGAASGITTTPCTSSTGPEIVAGASSASYAGYCRPPAVDIRAEWRM